MADGNERDSRSTRDVLAALIESTAAVATATDEELRAMEVRAAYEGRRERILRSGIKSVLRAEDRKRVLDDELQPTQALGEVQSWLAKAMRPRDPDRNMLVLCGHPGTGKTLAAGWAISRVGGRYVTTEEYLRAYGRWQRDITRDDGTSIELSRYEAPGLIVLDEIGTERDASLMRDALHRLVDRRQTRRRYLTVMITNLSRAAFVQRLRDGTYDPRTLSRMTRDAVSVGIEGDDLRGDSMRKGAW
jgi:DNA replication protein DnaC